MFDEILVRIVGMFGVIGVYASCVVLEAAYHALMEKGKNKNWVIFLIIATFCCSACMWTYVGTL